MAFSNENIRLRELRRHRVFPSRSGVPVSESLVNILADIRRYTEGAAKVKLPGGIVGKTSYVLMSVAGAFAVIVCAVRSENLGYVAVGALTLIVLLTFRRLFQFAERHPQVAILEGGEYVAYHQMQLAQKGIGALPDAASEAADAQAIPLPAAEQRAVESPDPLPLEQPKSDRPNSNG